MPLIQDFVPVDQGFEAVAGELLADDHVGLARRLDGSGSPTGSAAEVGAPRFQDETLVIPVHFRGDHAPFDHLDGELRVEPVESDHTHLALTGSYNASSLSRRDARVRQRLVGSWARSTLTRVSGSIGTAAT